MDYHKTLLVVYIYKVRNDWDILSTRVICIESLLTVLYVFLSIQTSKKGQKKEKKQIKRKKEKLSGHNINQSKRSQNFAQAIGTRNKEQKKKKDDEACVLCFSHP